MVARCKKRDAAIAAGLTRYNTDKPCGKGHLADRLVSTHQCIECAKTNTLAWNERNKERVALAQAKRARAWYLENREQANEASLSWYRRNVERCSKRVVSWAANNPERVKATKERFFTSNPGIEMAYAAKRRAAEAQRTPSWADHDIIDSLYALAAIYRSFGHDVHVDHELPLRGKLVSGLHVHQNLQIIPAVLNLQKNAKFTP